MVNNYCVILFIKSPERGMVKSRLALTLPEDVVLDLYKCFVDDIIEMLLGGKYSLKIFFSPSESRQRIVQWLGDKHDLYPQTGDDLGERMKNAFKMVYAQGLQSALLIGSDSPDLPNPIIDEALISLKDHDAVIGPSYDGGYYLIGFREEAFLPQAFDGIAWSTKEVFTQTTDILRNAGRLVHVLPQWRDVDSFDDLKALLFNSPNASFTESATIKYMQNNKYEQLWEMKSIKVF